MGIRSITERRWFPWVAVGVIVVGFVNFFAFIAISSALGGDALNGYARDGHYYVASHGSYTEVSQTVWTLNRIHALLTMLSWPAVMLAMASWCFATRSRSPWGVARAGRTMTRASPAFGRPGPRCGRVAPAASQVV
jgi:hypothetical protein